MVFVQASWANCLFAINETYVLKMLIITLKLPDVIFLNGGGQLDQIFNRYKLLLFTITIYRPFNIQQALTMGKDRTKGR